MSERRTVALRDVLTRVTRPFQLDDESEYATLGVRWYAAGCFLKEGQKGRTIAAKTLNAVEVGDIVFSRLFAWKGSFGVVHAEHVGAVASNEFPTYRASSDLLPEYFELWAGREEVWNDADAGSTGTTANSRNRLSEDSFLDMTIELPELLEQRALVSVGHHLRRAADAAGAQASSLRQLLSALWEQVWHQDLVECPKSRVGDVTGVSSGGTPSRKRPDYFTGEIPWVKTGEVAFNELAETEEHISDTALRESSAKLLPAGTVIVAMYGQGATRGRSAILMRDMATNQACAGIKPCDVLLPRYLFHWLWWSYERIRNEAEGSSQPNLNKRIIEDLELPIPPVDDQAKIVARLDAILDCARAASTEMREAENLSRAAIAELVGGSLSAERVVALSAAGTHG